MPSYKRCEPAIKELAASIIAEFESHKPIADRGVKLDLLFAFGDRDETTGELTNHALTKNGIRALGITRIINLKDRTKGLGDVEICLDHDWWSEVDEAEQKALLDHELHHIAVTDKVDDLGRPKIKLRKHDVEVGWFRVVAQRHGKHSIERRQAAMIMERDGQYFWPEISKAVEGRIGRLEIHQKNKP